MELQGKADTSKEASAMSSISAGTLIPRDASKLDHVDEYFECITACPTHKDTECVTECVDQLRDSTDPQLDVPSF